MPPTIDGLLLLGWMERDDAVECLREHCFSDPPLTVAEAEDLWMVYRDRVAALPVRAAMPPARMPIPEADRQHATLFKTHFRNMPNNDVVDVINVNPLELVAFQFYVAVGRADEHRNQPGRWCRKTLVMNRPSVPLQGRFENGVVKFMLPHAEHGFAVQPDGAIRIQQGGGTVAAVGVQGRLVLKAGYHRSFAFARAAMNAPDAKDKFMLLALTRTLPPQLDPTFPNQGLRTTILGDRAPLFGDFFDAALAMPVKLRKKRYEAQFHIRAINEP